MLKETYLANLRNLSAKAIKIRVIRPSRLGPSKGLLRDWDARRITWSEYESRFKSEMQAKPAAISQMREIKKLAETQDVYLYCYEKPPKHCHRFILIDLIQGLK